MNGISVNIVVMLLRGIPECMLVVLAMHIFTHTKLEIKKYLLLCLIYTTATYLIRFLPIALGVHSVLALFFMILSFQLIYKGHVSEFLSTIIAAGYVLVLLATSEVANMIILIAIYGKIKAQDLFTSDNGITKTIYSYPSIILFGLIILCIYIIKKKKYKKVSNNGETREEACS